MKVKIWGARGSIPSPLKPNEVREKICQAIFNLGDTDIKNPEAVRVYVDKLPVLVGGTAGGNTPCVEIRADNEIFIVDAGSGIRDLGLELMKGACGRGEGVIHLFFSHAHWDHIQGFPFFRPAFIPGNRIFIYTVHSYDWRKIVLEEQQRSINFPVSINYMQASLEFIQLQPEQTIEIGAVKINNILTIHPGDTYAFRFESPHAVFVYASDAEYKQANESSLRPYINFFKGADVLIFDSQLTLKEVTLDKVDWGHSSALIGVDLARRAGVKKLVLFHHDPTDSDADLKRVQEEAIEYQTHNTLYLPCEVVVGYEGLTFDLRPASVVGLQYLPQEDAAVLTLAPIFDERRVDEFEQQLDNLTKTGWPSRLIIDLSKVKALAIIGLRPLVSLRKQHPDKLIVLAGPSKQVRWVIKLAGFSDFFTVYPSVQAALSNSEEQDETTDRIINGRYKIKEEIGHSWMGVVFRAVDTQLDNRSVAIKTLASSFSQNAINRFLHQASQIIGLDHPNIVEVFECDIDHNLAYIVQELVDGKTLHQIIEENNADFMPIDRTIDIGLNIAFALEYAHGRGVIHGDLKPKNIFLTDNNKNKLKLSDFGLGRLDEGHNLIDSPVVLLTACYLSPEQILGKAIDARTDLYALGVILYELVTGQLPFQGSDREVMNSHLNDIPLSPRSLNPGLSRPLEHLILKLLAKEPDKRYATAHQTRRILGNLGMRAEGYTGGMANLTHQQHRALIGRKQDLNELLSCWDDVCAGHGQLAFITGEAGIGKTRLAQVLASKIDAGTLLIGHCYALEGGLAYQPFIEALRTYFVTMPHNATDKKVELMLSNVARLVPEIRNMLPNLPEPPALDPKQEQLRMMDSMTQYIEQATRDAPWLLIVDDLHWADQSSLQLLHYLARNCHSMSLLIICTYRDTDLGYDHPLTDVLHSLQRTPGYKTLKLDRLNKLEVSSLLTDIWGQPVPTALLDKIYQVTEGNPFYIEEVAKGLVDDGAVRWQDGEWHFATLGDIRLPKTVYDAVLQRVSHLKRDTQNLLRQAAVMGRNFSFDDLYEVSNIPEWILLEHLDVALERQLIQEAPGGMIRFSHAEIRQVLYEDLSILRRRMLHRQVGEALERRYISDLSLIAEELAHHFDEAGEFEKALVYSIQAARHADMAYASRTALIWYSQALKLLNQLGMKKSTRQQMFDLLLARERLYNRQGMRDKQAADLATAQEVSRVLNDINKQSQVHNRQAYYYRLINNYTLANEHAKLGLQAARQAKNVVLEGESLINLAYIAVNQDQFQEAQQNLETAQTILEKTDDRRGEAIVLDGLGNLYNHLNNYEQARICYEQSLKMNRSIGNRRGEATCLNNLGELERHLGNYSVANSYYEQTLGIVQTIGDRQGEASALNNLGQTALALGRYEMAKLYIERALPIHQSIEDQMGIAMSSNILSAIYSVQGEYELAYAESEQALNLFQRLDSHINIANTYLLLGQVLEGLNKLEEAYKAYTDSLTCQLDIGNEAGAVDARTGEAGCLLAQGQVDDALEKIELNIIWINKHNLNGVAQPFRFYLTAYKALKAGDKDKMAEEILGEGYKILQDRANSITDDELRQSFLENVPQNAAVVVEWESSDR